MVTVAIRRSNIGQNPDEPNLLDVLSPDRYTILPNTAGCFNVEDAVNNNNVLNNVLRNADVDALQNFLNENDVLNEALNQNDVAVEDVVAVDVLSDGTVVVFEE